MSQGRLQGKVAVVTGASRGIGLAIARALIAEQCAVAITARDGVRLKAAREELSPYEVVSRLGLRLVSFPCDVADEKAVANLFARIKEGLGHVDILVNNAGISHALCQVEHFSLEIWQRTLETNLTGMFLCTRAALPLMSAGSTIVNNLSVAARTVFAGESAYCASKFGALGFTDALREELRPRGVRVISLIPGATDTEIWQQFWPDAPRDKMMRPETVAQALVSALVLPENATIEELVLAPTSGKL